jgi:hypothetical protein
MSKPCPPPPPVFVAASSFTPDADEVGRRYLKVDVGDKFGEVATMARQERCIYVVRLGHLLGAEQGWVSEDVLTLRTTAAEAPKACIVSMDDVMSSGNFGSPFPEFKPFLGGWSACLKMLLGLSGMWKDDRGRKAKTYKLTVFSEEGYANVLTELPCGGFRQGRGLVKIREVAHGVFCILWSETFVLNGEASAEQLQWLPVNEATHSTWTWKKKV